MSTGLYIHITRAPGTIVTAELYNGAHRNHLDNDIPASCGAHSDNLAMYRATTDPYPLSVAAPAPALGTELEQIRFVIANIKETLAGTPPTYWYSPATGGLSGSSYFTHGAAVTKGSQIITTKTVTPITFDTVNYDSGVVLPTFDPFWSASHVTRLTAPVAGLYQLTGNAAWSAGITAANIAIFIRINGSKLIAAQEWPILGTSAVRYQSVGSQYVFQAGEYAELVVFHTAASIMAVTGPTLSMTLIAPLAAVPPQTIFTLSVTESGTGTGIVSSSPGDIVSPGVNSDQYVSGTNVLLGAGADGGSVFVAWTGVPAGHETDNPVSVPMTADKSVDAQFDSLTPPGVKFVMPTYIGDSIDDGGGTTAFASLGWNSGWWASEADALIQVAQDVTISTWSVQLPSAVGGGDSITFSIMLNGIAQTGIDIVCGAGSTGAHADGTVTAVAGDTLSIRGVASGATPAAILINGFMFGCTSATPMVAQMVIPSASPFKVAPEGSQGAGQNAVAFGTTFEASFNPMTVPQNFSALTMQLSAAGTGSIQPRVGGSNTGGALSFTAVDHATGAVAYSLTRPTSGATFLTNYGDMLATGISGSRLRVMSAYTMDTGFENWCVLVSGLSYLPVGVSAATTLAEAHAMGANLARRGNTIATATEEQLQLRWPNMPGTLQYFTMVTSTGSAVSVPYTVTGEVRVNGATGIVGPATAAVSPSTGEVASEDGSAVNVFVDDLVNFGCTISAGSNINSGSKLLYGVGFLAA